MRLPTASRSFRPTSMRRTTGSSRSTRDASATAWAASKAPVLRPSRRSSPLAPPVRQSLANLTPTRDAGLVAGIVTAMRTQTSRRGKMAFVTLDDGAGSAEIVVFNETFDAARALLREDQLVIVEARVMQRAG